MAYDFKKEYKDLYLPKQKPMFIDVPAMTFVAVAGAGNPNKEGGAYQQAMGLLYGFSYAVKMSKMGSWQPDGYFDYVVPPLEGLWWAGAGAFDGVSIVDKNALSWVSLIRQPDFVTREVFDRICEQLSVKKPELSADLGLDKLRFLRFSEGKCAQIMHKGSYDDEPETIAKLSEFIASEGMQTDIAEGGESPVGHNAFCEFDTETILGALDVDGDCPTIRLHHELYLGDPRRTKPENLKTVIRHPIK